jgi:hypothetical protein
MSEAAKLPAHLIEPSKRCLRDVQVGESADVAFAAFRPDAAGRCYLDPDAELRAACSATVQVERRADGYHVTLRDPELRWWPGERSTKSWYPVVSITEAAK